MSFRFYRKLYANGYGVQLTLPIDIVRTLGVKAGDDVSYEVVEDSVVLRFPKPIQEEEEQPEPPAMAEEQPDPLTSVAERQVEAVG